jgi:hypothetical protein
MRQFKVIVLGLLLVLSVLFQTTTAQYLPTDARALNGTRVPFPITTEKPKNVPLVEQVGAIGMTVSDMDASIDFYSRVLSFEPLARNAHDVRVSDITRLYTREKHNATLLRRAIEVEALPESWRGYFQHQLEKAALKDDR